MKKRLIIGFATLLVMCCALIGHVSAAKTSVDAKVPSEVPENNVTLNAILDTSFDFSGISFQGTDGGIITGKNDIRKILITEAPDYEDLNNIKGNLWFSVYCLDGSLKYPQYSIINMQTMGKDWSKTTSQEKVTFYTAFALFNDSKNTSVFKKALGTNIDASIEFAENTDFEFLAESLDAGVTVSVNVTSLTFIEQSGGSIQRTVVITAEDLGAPKDSSYEVSINPKEILLDKYSSKIMNENNYSHALWILEHSYPTLSLEKTFELVGVDYFDLFAEKALANQNVTTMLQAILQGEVPEQSQFTNALKALDKCEAKSQIASFFNKTEDDITPEFCTTNMNNLKTLSGFDAYEDYVYSTIQYAIWKATDSFVTESGEKLGASLQKTDVNTPLTDSEVNALNKLYQYLIAPRNEYNGYLNRQFGTTIDVTNPESGKEIYKETNEYYVYGPFGISHDFVDLEKVQLSIENAVEGVSIVNQNEEEISEINVSEEFYIKCLKSKEITKIDLKVSSDDAVTFINNDGKNERGRVYYAYYPLAQNVVSGGILHNKYAEESFTINFNPKTGNESLGAIFVIMLIVASLAFVGISYKEKPVGLN